MHVRVFPRQRIYNERLWSIQSSLYSRLIQLHQLGECTRARNQGHVQVRPGLGFQSYHGALRKEASPVTVTPKTAFFVVISCLLFVEL